MTGGGIKTRPFGRTGWQVAEVGFGAWQIGGGGTWDHVADQDSLKALHAYLDAGGNLIDTANVYGHGHSECLIAQVLKERAAVGKTNRIYVITKAGRAHGDTEALMSSQPHGPQNYTLEALRASIEGSRRRLGVKTLDLVQLHCPPLSVLQEGQVFKDLRKLQHEGLFTFWGVSVETVEEALLSIEQPDCVSIQLVFNAFRLKPTESFFAAAKTKNIAVIARVPLASGLLSGKITPEYIASLGQADHRVNNRSGQHFDKGETFSGLGEHLEDAAFPAVAALKALVPKNATLAQMALRWVLAHDAVSAVIPGCRTVDMVMDNIDASNLAPLSDEIMTEVTSIYDRYIRKHVHSLW